ncbi:unnamed protein product [Durusdinium trenchii]
MASYQQVQSIGEPTPLGPAAARRWEAMDAAQEALKLHRAEVDGEQSEAQPRSSDVCLRRFPDLRRAVLARRSALRFAGDEALGKAAFARVLAAACECSVEPRVVRTGRRMKVHLLMMIHRVEGFEPGLYLLVRGQLDDFSDISGAS